jgi:hypothetical protein
MSNLNSSTKKKGKANYESAWIKKGRTASTRRENRVNKTKVKRFLDKLIEKDYYGI